MASPVTLSWSGLAAVRGWCLPLRIRFLLTSFFSSAFGTVADGGEDLRVAFQSSADGASQFFRLYVPTGYDPAKPGPLVIALHGSGGNENSFFDDEAHYPARHGLKFAAEKHHVLVACPSARGNTNYRGLGEISVFDVLQEVKRRYRVDPERVYLTGHSMGGTGATDLTLHHPGVFAAVVPIAAARSIRWVAANAEHTPFWWIAGELDQAFYKLGVAVGFERMQRLGYEVQLTEVAGEGHYGVARDFQPVFDWLLQHRRVAHPRSFTLEVDTLLHPRAYWITVESIAQRGTVATVQARAISPQRAHLKLDNVAAVSLWPDPAIFDANATFEIEIGEHTVRLDRVPTGHEVILTRQLNIWTTDMRKRTVHEVPSYRKHPVTMAPTAMDHTGVESNLGSWIADAMRAATGADVALYNHRKTDADRPIPAGTVDIMDLLQCSLPGDQDLVTVKLSGRDILEILDANIPARATADGPAANLLVQLSGGSYTFDPLLTPGGRIVASSFQPDRHYVVVLEGQVVERETMRLAGRFKRLPYTTTSVPFTLALYGLASRAREITRDAATRVRQAK